jgi:hypothetical protein
MYYGHMLCKEILCMNSAGEHALVWESSLCLHCKEGVAVTHAAAITNFPTETSHYDNASDE